MWPTSVKIAGAAVALDVVLADCVIRQGRGSIDDGPLASSAQLRLENVTRAYSRTFMVGVSLEVEADGAPRFTGSITDATLDDDVLTVIGVGVLATLSRYSIGAGDWPAEVWSDRVTRAFHEAGVDDLLVLEFDGEFDPMLVERAGTVDEPLEPLQLADYVQQLAQDVGAAIVDTPDGHVLIQTIGSRQPSSVVTWEQVRPTLAWQDALGAWDEATSSSNFDPEAPPSSSVIDPADVLYVPEWEQTNALENEVEVTLGDGETKVTATAPASVDLFGPYPGAITTQLELPADAGTRANDRIRARSFPRWSIPSLTLLRGYPLQVGRQVLVTDFPDPSPYSDWNPVVEGWADTIRGDVWTCEVAVSDPQLSGLTLTWNGVPSALAWNEVDPACRWLDALELADLIPATREENVRA